jgi:adenylylsulfate kinase
MDSLRKVMTPRPKYSDEERENVYATLIFIARLLNQNGINTIIDATGNLRKYRELARKELNKFAIAYTKCPLVICIERESRREKTFDAPTEIYDKGRNGRSTTVPGLNVPYEEPFEAEIVVRTDKETVDESTEKLYNFILNWKNRKQGSNS